MITCPTKKKNETNPCRLTLFAGVDSLSSIQKIIHFHNIMRGTEFLKRIVCALAQSTKPDPEIAAHTQTYLSSMLSVL